MTERFVKQIGVEYPPETCGRNAYLVETPTVSPGGGIYNFIERISRLMGFREGGLTGYSMGRRGEELNLIALMDSGTTSCLLDRRADSSVKVEAKSPLMSGDLKAKVGPRLAVSVWRYR